MASKSLKLTSNLHITVGSYISAPQKEEPLHSGLKSASAPQWEVVLLNNSNRTGMLPQESAKSCKELFQLHHKTKIRRIQYWVEEMQSLEICLRSQKMQITQEANTCRNCYRTRSFHDDTLHAFWGLYK